MGNDSTAVRGTELDVARAAARAKIGARMIKEKGKKMAFSLSDDQKRLLGEAPAIRKHPVIPTVAQILGDRYTPQLRVSFPDIEPPFVPTGFLLLCQLRTPGKLSKGGLIIPDDSKDAEKYRVQTALVRAMGPAAFKNRATMEPWPEGDWCVPGEFVRTPMYGGDRIAVPFGSGDDEALFIAIKDGDITGVITGDPLAIKTLI